MGWTALLVAEDENPRSRLVTELLASDAYGSMEARAAAFVRQGGGCRATFFNYRSERVIRRPRNPVSRPRNPVSVHLFGQE